MQPLGGAPLPQRPLSKGEESKATGLSGPCLFLGRGRVKSAVETSLLHTLVLCFHDTPHRPLWTSTGITPFDTICEL